MANLPKDQDSRATGSKARAIVHRLFDAECWEYREITGIDVGLDCAFDLIEDDEWTGNYIECQVKGRTQPYFTNEGQSVSISIKTSTINYALRRPSTFILLLVRIDPEEVYYLPVEEYFINNASERKKLKNQSSITLRIPVGNRISQEGRELIPFAKMRYQVDSSDDIIKLTT